MIDVVVIGGGGHARVLIDMLQLSAEYRVIGFTAVDSNAGLHDIYGVPFLGDDEILSKYSPDQIKLASGIGCVHHNNLRQNIYKRFNSLGYSFLQILHPAAVVSQHASIGDGVQVMAGAVIQAGCLIDTNTIINTKASIDHDCQVGRHVHVAVGATVSGGVVVEDEVFIGCGSVILQGVKLGKGCVVGAGAVVLCDVVAGDTVVGVPAGSVKNV